MSIFDLKPYLKATILDIRRPNCPIPIDKRILFDANVLFFCCYDRFSLLEAIHKEPSEYQITEYSKFFKKLLSSNTILFVHKIGILEFARRVEKAELQILYCEKEGTSEIGEDFSLKGLRRAYPQDYSNIQGQLAIYLNSIKKTFKLLNREISIDQLLTDFLMEWRNSLADPADAMMVAEAKQEGIASILSDDADFATFKNIKLYTANRNVLNPQ